MLSFFFFNKILYKEYKLAPLYSIYFTPGVIDSSMCDKGVTVHPIYEKPPADLGIFFSYATLSLRPLDELVLSALGKLLLEIHYPDYLIDGEHVDNATSINDTLFQESHDDGAKGIAT